MRKKELVVVAMSGGVDSSVAAALLKSKGYEVIGITMCFNLSDSGRKRPACCSRQGIEDARRVAQRLAIRHYVLNMRKALDEYVIKDFCREYLRGKTPNPCIRCNQYIKFGLLLKKAFSLGAGFLATGHYARIERVDSKNYLLKKAKDSNKDQSYFLYRLNQAQLGHILFPLGDYTKGEVRKLAVKFGLAVADKPGSQEICFLPGEDYREFLVSRAKDKIRPGPIVDRQGNLLGRHKGVAFYTVGQREGLGIAKGYPLYITGIDSRKNQLVVGTKKEASKSAFLVNKAHFIHSRPENLALEGKDKKWPLSIPLQEAAGFKPRSSILKKPEKKVAVKVKIRYNHKEMPAWVWPFGRNLRARFRKPQFAITPGQSAVFYDKDIVLGGGIIDKALA
ncbi:MAG: tRNA 2-thiouridine(34) synthase MnmA [Candidatus Omnitrophica bacterium]|nr:tRNA 2-thiouridine(34) synthase MnmA [Candidatus Omnitrophota bacterium]